VWMCVCHNTNYAQFAGTSFPRLFGIRPVSGFSQNIQGNCFAFKSFTRLRRKLVHYGDTRMNDNAGAFKNSIIRRSLAVTLAKIELILEPRRCMLIVSKNENLRTKFWKARRTCKRTFHQTRYSGLYKILFKVFLNFFKFYFYSALTDIWKRFEHKFPVYITDLVFYEITEPYFKILWKLPLDVNREKKLSLSHPFTPPVVNVLIFFNIPVVQ